MMEHKKFVIKSRSAHILLANGIANLNRNGICQVILYMLNGSWGLDAAQWVHQGGRLSCQPKPQLGILDTKPIC